MKNVVTGKVLEKTWNPTEKVQEATIEYLRQGFLDSL
jgi:translation elongation factor P/translation initiation factor 5A